MKKLAIKYIVTYIVMLVILFGAFCLDDLKNYHTMHTYNSLTIINFVIDQKVMIIDGGNIYIIVSVETSHILYELPKSIYKLKKEPYRFLNKDGYKAYMEVTINK